MWKMRLLCKVSSKYWPDHTMSININHIINFLLVNHLFNVNQMYSVLPKRREMPSTRRDEMPNRPMATVLNTGWHWDYGMKMLWVLWGFRTALQNPARAWTMACKSKEECPAPTPSPHLEELHVELIQPSLSSEFNSDLFLWLDEKISQKIALSHWNCFKDLALRRQNTFLHDGKK